MSQKAVLKRVLILSLLVGLFGCQKKPELTLDTEPIEPPSSVAPVGNTTEPGENTASLIPETPTSEAIISTENTDNDKTTQSQVVDPLNESENETQAEPNPATPATKPTQPKQVFSEPVQPKHTPVASPQVQRVAPAQQPITNRTTLIDKPAADKTVAPQAPVSPEAPKPQPVGELFKPISKPASLAMPSLPSANKPKPASVKPTESLAPMPDR